MPHLVSRAHTWLGLGALLVATLLASGTAHAVVLEDTGAALLTNDAVRKAYLGG
jgi:hypothetical protein